MIATANKSMNEANDRDPFNNNSYGTTVDQGYKMVSLPVLDVHLTALERERMAERDELMGTLGRLHRGHDRGVEYRPFLGAVAARAQRARHAARQPHARLGDGDPMRNVLRPHIHHGGLPACVEMRESAARHQPPM